MLLRTTHVLALSAITIINVDCLAQTTGPQPGDPAPPITIEHLSNAELGAQATWEALADETIVLEFWGTWCAPCVAAIPHLNELAEELQDEDFTFLSVTFEDQPIIEKFLARRPMKSWIGHDLDRSMVKAYAIAGWPTTFVVRNGVVAARTSPSLLTAARLREYRDGRIDKPTAPENNGPSKDQVGADGRPIAYSLRTGVDPFSTYQERAKFHCLVREAGQLSGMATSDWGFTLAGQPIRAIVAAVWEMPRYAVVGDDVIEEQRYDVIVSLPHDQRAFFLPLVQQIVSKTMEIDVVETVDTIDGYELTVSNDGLLLESGVGDSAGSGFRSDGSTFTITSASMKLDSLIRAVSRNVVKAPIHNATSLEGSFFIDLSFPTHDIPAAIDAFREQTGLLLTPKQIEMPVLKVKTNSTAEKQPAP